MKKKHSWGKQEQETQQVKLGSKRVENVLGVLQFSSKNGTGRAFQETSKQRQVRFAE